VPITLRLRVPAARAYLDVVLEALVRCNVLWLDAHPATRPLYGAGVRYQRERLAEDWLMIPELYAAGVGDCEDLGAARAAELRVFDGCPARAFAARSGQRSFHTLVDACGVVEDPSRRLGMKGRG